MAGEVTVGGGDDRMGRVWERAALGHVAAAFALAWQASPNAFVFRLVLTLLNGMTPLAVAWLTKMVLDRLVVPDAVDTDQILILVVLLAAAGVTTALLLQLDQYAQSRMGRAIEVAARQRLYRAVIGFQGLTRFENPRFHDRLQLAGSAATAGPTQLFNSVLSLAGGAVTVTGFVGTLGLLNPWMLVVVMVAAVPTLRAEVLLSRHRARMMDMVGPATRREIFYAALLTSVSAAKEIRLFGLGDLFGARMLTEMRAINAEHEKMERRDLVIQGLLGLGGAAVAGAGLIWAVMAARSGRLSVGDVSVFIASVAGMQSGLSRLVSSIGVGHHAILMFHHYRYVVGQGPDLPILAEQQERPLPVLRQGIELRDVWFRYDDDLPWILRGVSISLPAGKATALVGLNGAGKSTLAKLLCRFYDPDRGAILWDGVDIRRFPVEQLRRRVRAVFQDFMDYDLSAAENIGLGDVDAIDDRQRIINAAKEADCHDIVQKLPQGYDTMLTRVFFDSADKENTSTGVVLSGGQWQRLAIARALMRDQCDLMILDEPSAGLDPEAEYELQRRLKQHRKGHTSVLIAHRLSTIRDADNIVVIAEGKVSEQGTHADLVALQGGYARLFALQASGYQEDAPPHA